MAKKNMVEVVLNDEKIECEGIYNLRKVYASADNVFVEQAGMVKEGNFYIDNNPYDGMGIGMDCIFLLAGKQWFRDCVKELRWYRDIRHYGNGFEYHMEDIMEEVINDWEPWCIKEGLPVNC